MRDTIRHFCAVSLVLTVGCITSYAEPPIGLLPVDPPAPIRRAPPIPPPIEVRDLDGFRPAPRPHGPGDALYSIGQPTDEEQLYLEYINRARADPAAEGTRLRTTTDPDVLSAYNSFGVDLDLMESQFAAIAPAAPLAMNAQLTAAARLHSEDMFTNEFQQHIGSDGSSPGQRVTAQGYSWITVGENIFAYAEGVFYGHAGFEVDWGPGPGGMQTPPGHRTSIHSADFREVGVGVVIGSNGSVGPQLVTEDFATRQSATPLVSGVVYYDLNGNSFYDLGEGIGGVNVDVEPGTFYAVTANSGGYAVPVLGNGTYTVTFTAAGLATEQQFITVTGAKNVKVDYLPVYSPPMISGPDPAIARQANTYTFTAVGGASGYDWGQAAAGPFTEVEGAENGLTDFTVSTSSGYNVVVDNPNGAGHVFHLAHPNPATDQILSYNRILLPGINAEVQFKSRLGTATAGQVARVQVSSDSGATWVDVFSQAGNGQPGEAVFTDHAASLASFAGAPILVRFVYDYTGGSFFPQTSTTPLAGWAIDDLSFSNTEELTGMVTMSIPEGASFVFEPPDVGDYLLRVRATIGTRVLGWGPAKRVTASDALPPPIVTVTEQTVSGGELLIDFEVTNYSPSLAFQLVTSQDLAGNWNPELSAILETLISDSKFRFTTSLGTAPQRFYRVQATPHSSLPQQRPGPIAF